MSPYFLRRVFAPIIYSAKEYWSDIQKPTEKHRQEYRSAVQKKHRLTCVRLNKQHNNTCWICESRLPGLLRPSPILAGQKILYFVRKLPGALSSQREGDRGSTRIADTKQGYIQATTKSRETKCCSLDQIIYQSWSLAQNGKMQDTWPDWYQTTTTRLHWGNGCQQVSCRFKPSDLDGCIGYTFFNYRHFSDWVDNLETNEGSRKKSYGFICPDALESRLTYSVEKPTSTFGLARHFARWFQSRFKS